jgi:glycosyltransferase involved in cell wall biosynthesis
MAESERRKKILHIVEDLNMGGLERVIETLVLGLDRRRYDVEVWCLARGGAIAEELLSLGVPVRILGLTSYYNPARVRELALILDAQRFDVVHTHGYFASTFARLALLLKSGPVIVHHLHTTDRSFKLRNRKIESLLSLCTDRIICVSQAVSQFAVESLGVHPQKIRVIYNTAFAVEDNPAVRKSARQAVLPGVPKGDFVIVSVASLTANKGHDVLLLAMKNLVARHCAVRCVIVGEGPERPVLESRIDRLGLRSHVFLAGLQLDVLPFLRMADVAVLTTVGREGLSVALIEGAAAGLPLVGSDLGGIPEVIKHEANGLLFSPGIPEALAKALCRLITDPGLRERMGRKSRAIYRERFSHEIMIGQIEQTYDEILQGRADAVASR